MLRHIPANLSPELVSTLMRMGHGDEIVLGDANFPGESLSDNVIRADGLGIPDLLDSICSLMPLDHYNEWQAALMSTVPGDCEPPVWNTYQEILHRHDDEPVVHHFERFEFYDHVAKHAKCVVITGETALYGNLILKKGVI